MSFKVGDVCLIVEGPHWTGPENDLVARVGIECVIDSLHPDITFGQCYCVTCVDGHKFTKIMGKSLRLKRPPSNYDGNQAGDWDLCPFQPYRQKERA